MQDKIDILNRQPVVDQLIDLVHILADRGKGCTFSLDGKWGSGKSFVLDMFERQLSLFQDPNAAGERYVIFHYNCWQYDFYEEPAIAIVAAICNEISKYNSILPQLPQTIRTTLGTVGNIGKELLGSYLQTKLGCNPMVLGEKFRHEQGELENEIADAHAFDTYYKFKEMLDLTKKQLATIASDKPVILVVDELDRCMPDYAIKVLERLHHLFDEDSKVIVILAVDREQLDRTVHHIFGVGALDKENQMCINYLKKFIRFSIPLDTGTISENFWERYSSVLSNYDVSDDKSELYLELPSKLFFYLDVRTQELCMDRLLTLHNLAFGDLNSASVLYFELIYQAIMARYPNMGSFDWLNRINSTQFTSSFVNEIGMHLFNYLKTLEASVTPHNIVRFINDGQQRNRVLKEIPLGITFWMFASLDDKPIKMDTCADYYLEGSSKYEVLVEGARRYHRLARLIK